MARAKNTDRAEARRRHRAAVAAADAGDDAGELAPAVSAAAVPRDSRPSGSARSTTAAPAQRPSIVEALRLSAQPPDVRADIRAFPQIVRRTTAVWLPAALVLAGGIVLFVGVRTTPEGGLSSQGSIAYLVAQLLVWPPTLIPTFLAGMLAPRAAWLCGLVVGALSGIVFATWVLFGGQIPADGQAAWLMQALVVGPVAGLATGAFAGFYRRFLRLSGPQQQRRQPSKSQKPAPKGR